MIKPYNRFHGGNSEERMEYTIKVNIDHNTKVYEGEGKTLTVWTLASCVDKLHKAYHAGDHLLSKAAANMSAWQERQFASDPMTKAWADDCARVWNEAFDIVLSNPEAPPPEPPKKPSLFGRKKA